MECSFRGVFEDGLIERVEKAIERLGWQGTVAVCGDTRPSTPALKSRIISVLMKNGNDVHDLGIGPTPYLSYYTKLHNCLGIMATASHNPEGDNGIKMFKGGVEAVDVEECNGRGPAKSIINADFRDGYIRALLNKADTEAIRDRQPIVIVDCANGTAGAFTPTLLRMAGAHVITIDAEHSNPFSRDSEPNERSLSYLPRLISGLGADFAVAHDVDGDRCRIITTHGVMDQDVQLFLMADYLCKGGETFVTTVEASQLVVDGMQRKGVNVEITPVGSNFVGRSAKKSNAVFGGEPCGEYVFPSLTHSADGVFAALMFTKMYCERGFSGPVPYYTIRGKVDNAGMKTKEKVFADIENRLMKELGVKEFTRLDGLLFTYSGAKVLVRGSNTQDIIRITCEHKDKGKAESVYRGVESIVKMCV